MSSRRRSRRARIELGGRKALKLKPLHAGPGDRVAVKTEDSPRCLLRVIRDRVRASSKSGHVRYGADRDEFRDAAKRRVEPADIR